MAYDEDLANRIRELIAGDPDVTEKRMFGGLAFLAGGHLSVAASGQGGLIVRVDPEASEALLTKPHARPEGRRSTMTQATISTPTEREIRIERVFDAPRDRVFAIYTDPELIPEWWGPRGTTAVVEEMDARTGGRWRFVLRNSDGTQTGFRGAYREVTPPERIVQTFEWDGMPGHVSVETATFEDLGEQTKVTTVSVFHTTEERDGMLASDMEGGLNETYDRLDEVLRRKA